MPREHTILFVDDEPCILDALRRGLHCQRADWDMHFAQSVDEALEMAHTLSLDAVVTDVTMPVRDGLDLLTTLQGSDVTCDIPVIILTGLADVDLKRRALELGACDLLNKPVVAEDLTARLRSALRLKSYQDELKEHKRTLERRVQERTIELEYSRLEIIWRLAKAGEYRDELTGNHVVRVGSYSRVLAEQLGMSGEFVDTIFLTSPLHDIGKIGVSDTILHKPGALSPEERMAMKQHCEIGHEILQENVLALAARLSRCGDDSETLQSSPENPFLKQAAMIALCHHEKWDGSGYPKRLRGSQIPIEARIVAIADVYDALSQARPYKPAFSDEKALAIMRDESPGHFDPEVFAAFTCVLSEFREIKRELSDAVRVAA